MTCSIKKKKRAWFLKEGALTFFSLVCAQNCYLLRGISLIFLSMVSVASVFARTASTQISQTQVVLMQSAYNVKTFAGDGSGSVFSIPNAVVADKNGNIYVTSPGNNKIIKITSAGIVTTLAGSGAAGTADGNGSSAQFYAPTGIAIDSAGNLFIADKLNNRIRKIAPNGDVTTFAGSSTGFSDGVGIAARFDGPYSLAIDSSDNLYVTDSNNNRIRKITPTGVVTTLAGSGVAGAANGIGIAAQFNLPFGIAVDNTGNLYVSDTWNHLIRKITPNGIVTTFSGSVAGFYDGIVTSALFSAPGGIAVDGLGNVYVADINNQRIRKITASGVVTTIAGTGAIGFVDNASGLQSLFNQPFGISVDSAGSIYVADTSNARIRKLTLNMPSPVTATKPVDTVAVGTQSVNTSAIATQPVGTVSTGTTRAVGTLAVGTQSVNTFAISTQPVGTVSTGTTHAAGTLAVGTQSVNTSAITTQPVPVGTVSTGTTPAAGTLAVGAQSVNTSAITTQPAPVATLATGTTHAAGTLAVGTQSANTSATTTQPTPVATLATGTTHAAGTLAVGTQLVNTSAITTQPVPVETLATGTTHAAGTLAVSTQSVNTSAISTQPVGTLATGTTHAAGTLAVGTQSVNTSAITTQPAPVATLATGTTHAAGTLAVGTQSVNTSAITTQPVPVETLATGTTHAAGTLAIAAQSVNAPAITTQPVPVETLATGTTHAAGTLAVAAQPVNTSAITTQPVGAPSVLAQPVSTMAVNAQSTTVRSDAASTVGTQISTSTVSAQLVSAPGRTQLMNAPIVSAQQANYSVVPIAQTGIIQKACVCEKRCDC